MKSRQLIHNEDPHAYARFVAVADRALMIFYAQVARKIRGVISILVALIPLAMLLVGSCKTAEMPGAYGSNAGDVQFRTALFPDKVKAVTGEYKPAAGYVSRALKYVSYAPESLNRLTSEEISYLFGKPSMERRDAEALVWQYKTRDCVVDFYFYRDGETAAPVSYVDFRGPEFGADADENRAACLGKIAAGDVISSRPV